MKCPTRKEVHEMIIAEKPETRQVLREAPGCIYRCGWCGYPVDKDGQPLPEIKDNDDAYDYLRKHEGCEVEQVNGFCCPNGAGDVW